MKTTSVVRLIALVLLLAALGMSSFQIAATSPGLGEKCESSGGGCKDNGCGGVCGQPVMRLPDGELMRFDDCWCLH